MKIVSTQKYLKPVILDYKTEVSSKQYMIMYISWTENPLIL